MDPLTLITITALLIAIFKKGSNKKMSITLPIISLGILLFIGFTMKDCTEKFCGVAEYIMVSPIILALTISSMVMSFIKPKKNN